MKHAWKIWAVILLLMLSPLGAQEIRPWDQNPRYWQYRGQPVLLLGASDDDNLFQWPDHQLKQHLDQLAQAGVNYVRNTMSDRRDRGWEVYPFRKLPRGKYDLEQFNPEYWRRLERFLLWTQQRRIVVQIEIWDRFDYSRKPWIVHPYNPANNINYTSAQSGLVLRYPKHPGANEQPFFFTTAQQQNNRIVLRYQQRFVDRLLDHTLKYDHVLYCVDNETSGDPRWGEYWAQYVRHRAAQRGRRVYVTQMWDAWDLRHPQHRNTLDHPELYAFVEVSQNNHQRGQTHWDRLLWVRQYLASRPRPTNSVKIYGADGNKFGHTNRDAVERFWRLLLAGAAAVRFHRPPAGLGASQLARINIQAARKVHRLVPFWNLRPALQLLKQREPNEAYAAAWPGKAVVIYFPQAGEVLLDLRHAQGKWKIFWMDLSRSRWAKEASLKGGEWARLAPPGPGGFVAVVAAPLRTSKRSDPTDDDASEAER